ncbi:MULTISPECIES: TrkH family potassium uptake protein [Clostridium]|uniref:Trk family potassium uptake protein n=1 Tax=Clostridium butyricum TaxID=1492 RepID=A0AAD0LBS6_CLOBU|nr:MULTISPECIES: TrkH family potassium uptake protein [Clostridium]AXB83595.1 Trk family potassium uptake protein [Clostridium butyricum]MCQ2016224.1 TrkH family potassium uptake protein [Clostridium butyricum]MCQ2023661.1 TrkH family potassium uptake protein [Clostridium butyricum]MDU2896649.1 TrkH family potassium uptake protein [Clostridium sp.]MDU3009077.1 TrkH family potassium uptake protein [Clostridium sp.]
MHKLKKPNFTYSQISAISFMSIILIGALLLTLPISSRSGEATPFIDALFTSASATCVTGLVVYDTYTHFSLFGQIVILSLIQIGGLGFMIIATLFSLMLKRKIGLKERGMLQESVSTVHIGGIVRLTKHILFGTVIFEAIGAIILALRFYPDMGLKQGLYNGVFHSISAFCNAGFDLMGRFEPSSSLTLYSGDIVVNLVIMSLIVVGGVGFLVWEDIFTNKLKFCKYRLHTKIVLVVTATLIIVPAIIFYSIERTNSFAGMGTTESWLASFFQSITPRTAGFNTVNIAELSEGSILLTIILMVIGGSPGSTAGGVKTTSFAVIILSLIASIRHTEDINVFNRRLERDVIKKAYDVITIYFMCCALAVLLICALQPFGLKEVFFEVVSALSTVGMSTGITPDLNSLSKFIITLLMFFGRVGSLSVALVFSEKKEYIPIRKPVEKISIG